jgi:acyl-CoA synthetase (AMP-forming)/AMP-acid ligase II
MLRDLVESPALAGADLSTLRFIVYGAAPTPEPLIRRALDALPCGLVQGYGLTEGSPALTVFTAEEHVRFAADPALGHRLASIGRVVPAARIVVLDGTGNPVPRGEEGEIAVRSTKSMVGYWHNPEATTATFRDGWLLTGDIGRQDEDGFLYLVDRKKDMLISGGLNVYPSEIEAVLSSHEDVREASVIGVADDRWGESPVAFVVARERRAGDVEELLDELRRLCRDRLAGYKQPRQIEVVTDMPRNETGKVLKNALRDLFEGGGE